MALVTAAPEKAHGGGPEGKHSRQTINFQIEKEGGVQMQPDRKYSPRLQIGQRVGIAGILVNAVLFIAKCAMGYLGNSVSVLADATNNLMDCASSLATLIGFKMCAKPADEHHPNGHGRMEYISGFVVSFFLSIFRQHYLLAKKAVLRIIKPRRRICPRNILDSYYGNRAEAVPSILYEIFK